MSYVANKSNLAQLTNIHYWDSIGNNWSGNLIGAATPFAFLPNPVTANDLVLFGIDSSFVNAGPFCSLVFDIGSAITGVTDIRWRYSDASGVLPTGWAAQAVQDNTDQGGAMTGVAFDTSGVGSVHWLQNVLWVVQNPTIGGVALGVTGLWICADIWTATGAGVPPTQNNRDIYTVVWAHAETPQVGGDMDALVSTTFDNVADTAAGMLALNHVYMGSRLLSRGANFTPFITMGATQFNPNFPFAPAPDAGPFTDMTVATGSVIRTAFPNLGWRLMATGTLRPALEAEYRGVFRMFMRVRQTGGVGSTVSVRFYVASLETPCYSKAATILAASVGNYDLIDLGTMTYPIQDLLPSESVSSNTLFLVEANGPVGGQTLDFSELIFLPVDENAVEAWSDIAWSQWARQDGRDLRFDSVHYPKYQLRTITYGAGTDSPHGYFDHTGKWMVMTPNDVQRHFFVAQDTSVSESECAACFRITDWTTVQRYSSMRGAR